MAKEQNHQHSTPFFSTLEVPSKKPQHMFPKNVGKNVFKIEFANTSRMQNSPIIYIQNLLNENIKKLNLEDHIMLDNPDISSEFLCIGSSVTTVNLVIHYITEIHLFLPFFLKKGYHPLFWSVITRV